MPGLKDVHSDRPLANFAVEYKNKAFIGDQVAPDVIVDKKSDEYWVYDKANNFQLPDTLRGPKGKANQASWDVDTDNYSCFDHSLRDFVPDALAGNADAGIPPRDKTNQTLVNLILLRKEKAIADKVTTAANYASGYKKTLTATTQFNNYGSSDPIGVVDDGKDALFEDPNVMILGQQVWKYLKRHPQILETIKGGASTDNPSIATLRLLAEIFEVETVLVGRARYRSSNPGQSTETYTYLWGKHIVLAYIDPEPSLQGVSAWKNFVWRQVATDMGWDVRIYRDESRGGGGDWIEPQTSYDIKAVCSDVAYLIENAVK